MIAARTVFADALRQFALAVYCTDEVPAACLLLQDRRDVDVNVLLFAAYVGAVRRQTLTQANLESARAAVGPWHRDVVRPLRAVRQRLKTGPAPAPNSATSELRQVQGLELEAEMIELDELGSLAASLDGPAAPGSADESAAAAMDVVIRAYQPGQLAADESHAVTVIAEAAARQIEVS